MVLRRIHPGARARQGDLPGDRSADRRHADFARHPDAQSASAIARAASSGSSANSCASRSTPRAASLGTRRRPPFPGLLAFQEEDAAVYFGRDDDIRRLIERLDARRAQGGAKLIALLGSSGSGKSSLLRAGVIPRLKRAGRNWIVVPAMRPRIHPVDELARALATASNPPLDWAKLRDDLSGADPARALDAFAGDLRVKAGAADAQILIPIDQAEELFGVADPDEARRFLEILSRALSENLPFTGGHGAEVGFPRAASIGGGADGAVRGILARTHAARPRAPDH